MALFSSKFKALETLATTKAEERTEAQLTAAQAELDKANAGIILVPHTEGITSPAQLDAHITALEQRAEKAEKEAKTEKARADAAQAKLTEAKITLDNTGADTPKTNQDTPPPTTETPENVERVKLMEAVKSTDHMKTAERLLGQN